MGYPETALNISSKIFNIHMRVNKGYIQRIIGPNELQLRAPHPECFELNFPITLGMSGSPLFTAKNNKRQLIGVCVGSYSSELVDYIVEDIADSGKLYQEKRIKVEQVGIAENILSLLSWCPELLEGKSLGEAITPYV